ncbi:Nitrous oxide reductase maturation protein NosF (ATPase) [hydrothermal vent metagenome]|uniref:Nitrous oxide reductase maturation protein NosF (ATPase) n=1 Tax=hydrothermal vent metagenome TaxID=652676 RepID=A0A3B0TRA3_9ZZZZ
MTSLIIKNVSKNFGQVHSLSEVSFTLEAGQCVALLGHNGAGKTTLIRMILGLSPISSGEIKVLGGAPGSAAARRFIGFLPESVAFHASLSGREQLHHFARLKSVALSKADELLDRVGLMEAAERKIRTYSKGMRQRIGLAQALLGKPKLVLLDEPTSGLDPVSRHEFYDIVDELAKGGSAVLLSSHALTELESRTDRIVILSKGRLVANAALADLREAARLPVRIMVKTSSENVDEVAQKLGGARINGQAVEMSCLQSEKLATLARVTALGDTIRDVEVTPASLEELYRHFSGIAKELAT